MEGMPSLQLERRQCHTAKQAAISAPKLLVARLKEGMSRCVSASLQSICEPSLTPWCYFNVLLYTCCSAHCLSFPFFNVLGFQTSMWKGLFVLHRVRLQGKWTEESTWSPDVERLLTQNTKEPFSSSVFSGYKRKHIFWSVPWRYSVLKWLKNFKCEIRGRHWHRARITACSSKG